MAKMFTVQDFFRRFPTDDTCLDHVMRTRFGERLACPKCGQTGKFHRLRKEPAYSCQWCGHRIYPMAGTPFERTRTPLQKWFYAMYLFTMSRHGVSAMELHRQLGITYKTAWRMGHEIRKYMGTVDGDGGLSGHVEIDETLVGGRQPGSGVGTGRNKGKSIVFGMIERGGEIITHVVPDVARKTLDPLITGTVKFGSRISTDEAGQYRHLSKWRYRHRSVNHSIDEYVRGNTHTNTIESFWSILKRSIRSTHVWVSGKHLPKYLAEFEYRHNMRGRGAFMFQRLLLSF